LNNKQPDRHQEVVEFIPKLRNALLDTLTAASNEAIVMSTAQMKDVLKLGLFATRQTNRVCTPEEMSNIWQSKRWEELETTFLKSKRYNASKALHTICQEIERASRMPGVETASKGSSVDNVAKRKADGGGESAREKSKKVKRRKDES
jgi:DNA polymerase phi